ncbi:MAG TPA: hypothetical protein VEU47_18825, partial [Candidatus Cybelea sp.]|nr:hypothetical protein [Candidatus Cybelea sp.]
MSVEDVRQADIAALGSAPARQQHIIGRLARNRSVVIGAAVVAVIIVIALLAPLLATTDPKAINPAYRNNVPGTEHVVQLADGSARTLRYWMGTDSLGRDVYSRVIYGSRISLIVGALVALISGAIGLTVGLVAGYVRWLDGLVMRIMDGLMAIPGI